MRRLLLAATDSSSRSAPVVAHHTRHAFTWVCLRSQADPGTKRTITAPTRLNERGLSDTTDSVWNRLCSTSSGVWQLHAFVRCRYTCVRCLPFLSRLLGSLGVVVCASPSSPRLRSPQHWCAHLAMQSAPSSIRPSCFSPNNTANLLNGSGPNRFLLTVYLLTLLPTKHTPTMIGKLTGRRLKRNDTTAAAAWFAADSDGGVLQGRGGDAGSLRRADWRGGDAGGQRSDQHILRAVPRQRGRSNVRAANCIRGTALSPSPYLAHLGTFLDFFLKVVRK